MSGKGLLKLSKLLVAALLISAVSSLANPLPEVVKMYRERDEYREYALLPYGILLLLIFYIYANNKD